MAFLLLAIAGLLVYAPALDGPFISDDLHYVRDNAYVHELSAENVRAIFDPRHVLLQMVENYAPVHLLLHAAGWQAFGDDTTGHHVVNVLLHALASLLLVVLFLRFGAGALAAALAGAVFLLHPANVEAVAWISQLKSSSSLVLMLLALLAHPRRPLAGAILFGLALLAKPTIAFALPVVAAFGATRATDRWLASDVDHADRGSWRWGWLGVWTAALALFAVAEWAAFSMTAGTVPPLYDDPWVRLRSTVGIALRYLWMAVSASGQSTFHEPDPVTSWLDPWFLGALVVLALITWRWLVVARRRHPEAVFWLWAAGAFAPISGVLPLPFPMADRYLYVILPGLLGAAVFALPELGRTIADAWRAEPARRTRVDAALRGVAVAASVALVVFFAVRTHERTRIWQSPALVMADAEKNYPDGVVAQTRRASRAAQAGDAAAAVAALRAASARGYNRMDQIMGDPAYGRIADDPSFQALLSDFAQEWLDRLGDLESPSAEELRVVGMAYAVQKRDEQAVRALERALELGGPQQEDTRRALAELKALQRSRSRGNDAR